MQGVDTPEVTPAEAYERSQGSKGVIVDVRESDELEQVLLDGAVHVPLGELQNRLDEIPKDREVFMLCHVGQRSAMATQFLRQLGHERVWNIKGGVMGWVRSGLPANWAEHG
ncbi:MAG: rhodanese-like domain-containing protein [Thermomicrobiaceae bacterium]